MRYCFWSYMQNECSNSIVPVAREGGNWLKSAMKWLIHRLLRGLRANPYGLQVYLKNIVYCRLLPRVSGINKNRYVFL
jgi:hypothetical protein